MAAHQRRYDLKKVEKKKKFGWLSKIPASAAFTVWRRPNLTAILAIASFDAKLLALLIIRLLVAFYEYVAVNILSKNFIYDYDYDYDCSAMCWWFEWEWDPGNRCEWMLRGSFSGPHIWVIPGLMQLSEGCGWKMSMKFKCYGKDHIHGLGWE